MRNQRSPEDLPLFEYAKNKEAAPTSAQTSYGEAKKEKKEPKKTVIDTPGGKRGTITITEDATSQTWEGLHPSDDTDDVWKK